MNRRNFLILAAALAAGCSTCPQAGLCDRLFPSRRACCAPPPPTCATAVMMPAPTAIPVPIPSAPAPSYPAPPNYPAPPPLHPSYYPTSSINSTPGNAVTYNADPMAALASTEGLTEIPSGSAVTSEPAKKRFSLFRVSRRSE